MTKWILLTLVSFSCFSAHANRPVTAEQLLAYQWCIKENPNKNKVERITLSSDGNIKTETVNLDNGQVEGQPRLGVWKMKDSNTVSVSDERGTILIAVSMSIDRKRIAMSDGRKLNGTADACVDKYPQHANR